MSITNPNANTRLFGFSIPNILMYVILAAVIFIFIKMGSIVGGIIDRIKKMFGFSGEDAQADNQKEITNSLTKDPAVKLELNTGNRNKAEALYNALDGFGYDLDAIYSIFRSITGPNQLKAIYVAFGTRTVGPPLFNVTGDLAACLKARMWDYQYTKNIGTKTNPYSIKDKIDQWILKSK